jgi:hypothetical protein
MANARFRASASVNLAAGEPSTASWSNNIVRCIISLIAIALLLIQGFFIIVPISLNLFATV